MKKNKTLVHTNVFHSYLAGTIKKKFKKLL